MTPDTTFPATTGVTDNAVANEETLTDTKGGQSRGKNSEKITKDIYIIKNKINDKVYIGQSKDAKDRWLKHLYSARHRPESQNISKAIHDLGEENFWYEILERSVPDYDEREKYWIKHFNSLSPNGYNILPGGPGNGHDIESINATFKTEEKLRPVIYDIQTSDMTLTAIAEKYQCSLGIIQSINAGDSYFNPSLEYPLRESYRYSDEKLKKVRYSLRYEHWKDFGTLAEEYNMDAGEINKINQGQTHRVDGEQYPIREGKVCFGIVQYVDEIIDLLKTTDVPQTEIARKFNIPVMAVSGINMGRNYHRDNESYPIRMNYQNSVKHGKRILDDNELLLIESSLRNPNKTLRDISREFDCPITTVQNINNGVVARYHKPGINYPIRDSRKIRQNKKNKKSQN